MKPYRFIASLITAFALTIPGVALADTAEEPVVFELFSEESTTTTTTAADTSPSLGDQFQTLSESLLAQWEAGVGLDMLGGDTSLIETFRTTFGTGVGFASLNSDYSDFFSLAEDFFGKGGFDGLVAAQGAKWASLIGGLTSPEFTPFQIGELAVPEEAITFGVVFEEATRFTATNPEVLESIRQGVAGPEALAKWRENIGLATESVNEKLGSTLPCSSAFLAAAGGGITAVREAGLDSGCGACVTAGLYSQGLLERLMDPDWNSVAINPVDGQTTAVEYEQLHPLVQSIFDLPGVVGNAEQLKPTLNYERAGQRKQVTECAASKNRISSSVRDVTDRIANTYIDRFGASGR